MPTQRDVISLLNDQEINAAGVHFELNTVSDIYYLLAKAPFTTPQIVERSDAVSSILIAKGWEVNAADQRAGAAR